MKLFKGRTTPVVLAALLLVGGANVAAYAANGKPLLLGKKNVETKAAVVVNNGAGPALKLKTKPSAPPLAVSSSKKVTNLNADKLDGLDSSQLTTTTRVLSDHDSATNRGSQFNWHFQLAPGTYALSFAAGVLPSSSPATVLCGFFTATKSMGWNSAPYAAAYSAAWASGAATHTVTNPAGENVTFFCNTSAGSFTLYGPTGVEIDITKINAVQNAPATARLSGATTKRLTGR